MDPQENRSKIRAALTKASNAPAGSPERAAALQEADDLGMETVEQIPGDTQRRQFIRGLGQEMRDIRDATS